MRVLVTGASGMLGGAVATLLRDRGEQITVLQRRASGLTGVRELRTDLADRGAMRAAVSGQDAVVHLAAKVDIVGAWSDYVAANIAGTAAVVDGCRAAGVGRLVHVSSPSVAHAGASLVGVGAATAEPATARGPYARSKAHAELIALGGDRRSENAASGLSVVVVRPHLVWGPGDRQLVARIVDRARAGRLPIIGSGASLVDTTYVDNAATAIVAALDAAERAHGERLVVSNGEPRPIAELVSSICRAAGVQPPRHRIATSIALAAGALGQRFSAARASWGAPPPEEPPLTRFLVEQLSTAHWFDQRHTRDVLAWSPTVSLDEGFERLTRAFARG